MSKESAALKKNVEDQLSRLLAQLDDLEELRDELEPDEVEEMRAETMEEMKEFEATLEKMMSSTSNWSMSSLDIAWRSRKLYGERSRRPMLFACLHPKAEMDCGSG